MSTHQSIQFGVIGLGIGEQHAYAVFKNKDCVLRSVCDRDTALASRIANQFPGVTAANNFEEILSDQEIQAVVIASYDDDHFSHVAAALEAGKHVFVEKPLCRSMEELLVIHGYLTEAQGRLALWSNLILRAAPLYQWLHEKVASGELGTIYSFDGDYLYGRLEKITDGWRSSVDNYSVVSGGAIHIIDLLLWITEERPVSVTATSNNISTNGTAFLYDDYVATTLEFTNGMTARITANFGCVHRHQHVIRIFGTEGTFLHDDKGARLHCSRDQNTDSDEIQLASLATHKSDLIGDFVSDILNSGHKARTKSTQTFLDTISVCSAINLATQSHKSEEVIYL